MFPLERIRGSLRSRSYSVARFLPRLKTPINTPDSPLTRSETLVIIIMSLCGCLLLISRGHCFNENKQANRSFNTFHKYIQLWLIICSLVSLTKQIVHLKVFTIIVSLCAYISQRALQWGYNVAVFLQFFPLKFSSVSLQCVRYM